MIVYVITRVEDDHQWLMTVNEDGTGSMAERPSSDTSIAWSAPDYFTVEQVQ